MGLAFKLGLVPFHVWAPDVYQGAPAPVAAFVATIVLALGVYPAPVQSLVTLSLPPRMAAAATRLGNGPRRRSALASDLACA